MIHFYDWTDSTVRCFYKHSNYHDCQISALFIFMFVNSVPFNRSVRIMDILYGVRLMDMFHGMS